MDRVRVVVGATVVAGVAWLVEGGLQAGHTQPDQHWAAIDRVIEAVFAVALLASTGAAAGFRDLFTTGRAGAVGTRVAQAGFGAMAVAATASLVHDGDTWGPVFMLALVAVLVGLLVMAVAGVRDKVLAWAAPIPILAMLLGMALSNHGGTFVIGLAWLGLGWLSVTAPALRRTPQPEPG
jgi:hypothetical protein